MFYIRLDPLFRGIDLSLLQTLYALGNSVNQYRNIQLHSKYFIHDIDIPHLQICTLSDIFAYCTHAHNSSKLYFRDTL